MKAYQLMRKVGSELKCAINDRLLELNVNIRIEEYNVNCVLLNNGLRLDRKAFLRLRNLIQTNKYNDLIDDYFATDINVADEARKEIKRRGSSAGGKAVMRSEHRDKIIRQAKINCLTAVSLGKARPKKIWNKGLTKETSESVARIAKHKMGCKNPMFGKTVSVEQKRVQSEQIRQKIKDGLFTPNVMNSFTRKNIEWNGIKYRSSWEVLFAANNIHLEYEKLRIPYDFNGNTHILLVDFYDRINKIVYEIKPTVMWNLEKNKAKKEAILEWCSTNKHEIVFVDENHIAKLATSMPKEIEDIFSVPTLRSLRKLTNENGE